MEILNYVKDHKKGLQFSAWLCDWMYQLSDEIEEMVKEDERDQVYSYVCRSIEEISKIDYESRNGKSGLTLLMESEED
jgi:hypothetical protein